MNEELAKKLCLKVVYGGHLSAEEKRVWEAYRQTEAGQAFLQGSNEMKSYLSTMATVQLIPDPPANLKQRFEVLVREKIKPEPAWRKVARWCSTLITVLLILFFLWLLLTEGWSDKLSALLFVIALLGLSLGLGSLGTRHGKKLLAQTDLANYLKQTHRQSKTLPNRIAAIACLMIVPVTIGLFRYHTNGLERALYEFFGILIIQGIGMAWYCYLIRRQRAADPDVWEWWENELEN